MSKSKSDPTFLNELYEQAQQKQQAFLDNISFRLGRERLTKPPKREVKGAPAFWQEAELPLEARIEQFITHFQQAGAHAQRFKGMEEAKAFVHSLIAETGAKQLIRHDDDLLRDLGADTLDGTAMTVWNTEGASEAEKEALTAKAAGADIGFIVADYAVSHTASLVTLSSPKKGRTVSLLPTILVALVPADRLVMKLGEVLRPLDALTPAERPAGIHFISGPSRSSDIENDLTIGVHGPGIVYALIIE